MNTVSMVVLTPEFPYCHGAEPCMHVSSGIGASDMTWGYSTPITPLITQEYNGGTNSGQAWQNSVSQGTATTSSTITVVLTQSRLVNCRPDPTRANRFS